MTQYNIPIIQVENNSRVETFDINNPTLPSWVDEGQFALQDYPYSERMKRKEYEDELEALQIELVKLQAWMNASGARVAVIFEGRDAAGKGGTIKAIRENMNHRTARNVALPKPTDLERSQWYFQRYVAHLPSAGEFVTFDRSWYNRAVVEPIMGFCSHRQYQDFLPSVQPFEELLVKDGIFVFKFWLNIGQAVQLKRFHDRLHNPLKRWKFSPVDIKGMAMWDEFTEYRDRMLNVTGHEAAPWCVVKANDKRRLRIATIKHILSPLPYDGKDETLVTEPDTKILSVHGV